jgi:hypothetical protein
MHPMIILWTHMSRELDNKGSIFIDLSKQGSSALRQVAHPGPNSTEFSSSDGGTQCNGDHFFLRGRIDPNGCQWPPTYSNWFILEVFQFGSFFLVFWVPDFRGHFEALNNVFRAHHSQNKDRVRF